MTVPVEAQDPYAAFRADLAPAPDADEAAKDAAALIAACAHYFAYKDLASFADEQAAWIQENYADLAAVDVDAWVEVNRARVQRLLSQAVADAKSMTPENRVFMLSMIAADVTA